MANIDLSAEHYRKHSSLQYGLAQNVLETISLCDKKRILDVGCGDGKITAEMAKESPSGKVIGIDASPNMIKFAKKNFSNCDFRCAKAEEMDFNDTFDLITCLSCLHWFRKPNAALANMARLLEKNGDLVILIYLKSQYSDCLEKALAYFPEYVPLSAFHSTRSLSEYADILKQHGLKISLCQTLDLVADYQDKKALMDYIKGWLVSYVPLPESLQDEYLEKVAKISEIYANSTLGFHIPYKTGVIKATK